MKKLLIGYWCGLVAMAQVPFVNFFGTTPASGNNLAGGIVAYYKFDEESGNALDSSGAGRHLTEAGTVSSELGKINTSRGISGTNYFTHPDHAAFEFGSGSFSILFWVFLGAVPEDGTELLVSKWRYAEYGSFQVNSFDAGGAEGFEFYVMQADQVIPLNWPQVQITLEAETWYCVAARANATTGTIHLDVRKSGGSWTSDVEDYDGTVYDSDALLVVNGSLDTGGGRVSEGQMSAGTRIDELAIYNRFVTDCERDHFFNDGDGLAKSQFDFQPCN